MGPGQSWVPLIGGLEKLCCEHKRIGEPKKFKNLAWEKHRKAQKIAWNKLKEKNSEMVREEPKNPEMVRKEPRKGSGMVSGGAQKGSKMVWGA